MHASMSLVRQEFQNGDHTLASVLETPVYESWLRCLAHNLPMDGPVDYDFMSTDQLKDVLPRWQPLINSSRRHLDALHKSISGAGWSVLFTDQQCNALRVYQSKDVTEQRIVQAFRQGAKLSESHIGTTAMSCALAAKRFVRVCGEEHYRSAHRNFNCAAVPVFDAIGRVCGTVDITNESPLADVGAYYLLEACARNIQIELIRAIPDAIVVELRAGHQPVGADHLVLAFSYDQQLVGANYIAQRFLRLDLQHQQVQFNDLFVDSFSTLFDKGLLKGYPFSLTLLGGISLQTEVLDLPGQSGPSVQVSTTVDKMIVQSPARDYGDSRIQTSVDKSLRVIGRLPVLLLGESGVGKEVIARELHDNSSAASGAFICLNCASIPETLIESELFGYEKGAFTGANRDGRIGKIQQANGGTLFLDEIGDMPIALQTRLLRVLETREVERLGSAKPLPVDFQLICATNKDLAASIDSGDFRQDLFYRINGYEVRIPPLRERPDIQGLAKRILHDVSNGTREFSLAALEFIAAYHWPGNVRELRNAIVYADTLAESDTLIDLEDLPDNLQHQMNNQAQLPLAETNSGLINEVYEKTIRQAIDLCGGNVTQAAKKLGISRATLYRRIAKTNN
ncbi:sigma-54-dependent Fis family transcriptional regulator [Alteromonas sp. ZYF713]|nr:sigma-54-dependent Fis family transcriptional regulator [Alteromonas sp. ZYF713]